MYDGLRGFDHHERRLRVALDFPKLFAGFVLVDPVLHKPRFTRPAHLHPLVFGALIRRDRWSSRWVALSVGQSIRRVDCG